MFQPPLSPECLVAQVVKYKLSHQHEQEYSCYFSWSGVCSSSLCLRGIPPASHSYALFGHHPPGSWLFLNKRMSEHKPMTPYLQDDSYQLKNDIGVNPTFWTEEMCHYAESPFRWSLQWYCSNIYSEFLILNSLNSDNIKDLEWLPLWRPFGIVVMSSLGRRATCTDSWQVQIGKRLRLFQSQSSWSTDENWGWLAPFLGGRGHGPERVAFLVGWRAGESISFDFHAFTL